jgi:hypothetical protein
MDKDKQHGEPVLWFDNSQSRDLVINSNINLATASRELAKPRSGGIPSEPRIRRSERARTLFSHNGYSDAAQDADGVIKKALSAGRIIPLSQSKPDAVTSA